MGIGHIITLRLPPDKLREVNLAFEHGIGAPSEQNSILPTITSKFFTTRKRRIANLAQPIPPEKSRKTRRSRQIRKTFNPSEKAKKSSQWNSTSPTHQSGSFCALPWNSGFGSVVEDSVSETIINRYLEAGVTFWTPLRYTLNGYQAEVIAAKNSWANGFANARARTALSCDQGRPSSTSFDAHSTHVQTRR